MSKYPNTFLVIKLVFRLEQLCGELRKILNKLAIHHFLRSKSMIFQTLFVAEVYYAFLTRWTCSNLIVICEGIAAFYDETFETGKRAYSLNHH